MIISSQYQVHTRTGTSSLATSVLLFVIAAPVWVYITKVISSE